jgi:hypothetical protein
MVRARVRMSASVDAAGAALGCCGLFAFALICRKALTNYNPAAAIAAAAAVWLAVSVMSWEIRKRRILGR